MERITVSLPPGTKTQLEAISRGRGCIRPNVSNEVALAVRVHIEANKKLAKAGAKTKGAQ